MSPDCRGGDQGDGGVTVIYRLCDGLLKGDVEVNAVGQGRDGVEANRLEGVEGGRVPQHHFPLKKLSVDKWKRKT